ncbi:hypothetical protein HF325_001489 [Metschnikowia pulcherrima]|uniref:Uncharacterized protein n=1 Tax=Metschnikowia pulcherrima TaxID=27326 RepID=A0A8H7GXE4_9ASCO|nr:hypothetical protein HF325_001489 [Metschnikowia pulcherrima]
MSSVSVYQRHADKVIALSNRLTKYKVSLAEVVFDLSFVANFIVGKLIHVFSQEEEIYNYYNNKGNFFNQWFVKKGWGWTTAAILVFYVVHLQKSPHNRVKIALGAIFKMGHSHVLVGAFHTVVFRSSDNGQGVCIHWGQMCADPNNHRHHWIQRAKPRILPSGREL